MIMKIRNTISNHLLCLFVQGKRDSLPGFFNIRQFKFNLVLEMVKAGVVKEEKSR